MTVMKGFAIYCDCGHPDCEAAIETQFMFTSNTLTQLRAQAKREGWKRTRDGKDLGPECGQEASDVNS